ncbi:MAG: sulfite exporter TauE/SafE family protein [Bacillota bacterium]|jgi:uncharacterized membrane protein YfcA|uniref:Probable membrane transporter protein n=1 Tax=Thermanaerosceptrum fracticalcis TaxID=1712410 RepID=A0A7G6E7D7_THEFR|nr:sulfite exporter TauE/SafE family protein [Thermanaerosceptrum fracticalcis]QNB47991.1 TSUP family transporter [Thermanaerosceptrum fracticalcis]
MTGFLAWLAAGGIVLFAAALQSITGFGFALLSVPMLLMVYDAKTAVGLNVIISFFSLVLLTLKVRESVVRPVVKNLFYGAAFGIPLGIYIFFHSDTHVLKIFISAVTIILSLILVGGIRLGRESNHWIERMVGSASGFLTGCIGMPGPPIILFLNNHGLPKDQFRATTAAYFVLVYPVSFILLFILGAITPLTVLTALSLLPFAFFGGRIGQHLFPFVPQQQFQRGVPLLVLATGLYSLLTTL